MGYTYVDGREFTLPPEGWSVEAMGYTEDDVTFYAAVAIFSYADESLIGYEVAREVTFATNDAACAAAQEWLNNQLQEV